MAGQSINDRLTAARYSIAGQGLAKSVCKATTEEVIGPKKKHLDYLLQCTNEPNVSIPQLANLLIERTQSQAWVIVFKALITVHTLMCYGNERFTQYLASSNCKFNLSGFLDKTGTTGAGGAAVPGNQPQLSYDMSTFIRRYAKYINEKAISYRTVAFDFCKVKRGKNEGAVRTMNTDQLLKTLPILQQHLDALLDFDCTSSELNNGVINAAFMLLFRDLIRLFACYNDGIINLLEKYFEMNKKQCRDALDCYKKFLIRMDRVSEFLKVAEAVGMDKSEIPDLKQAPSSLLEALEGHLASLEGKKPPVAGGAFGAPPSNGATNGAAATAGATAAANGGATANGATFGMDEMTKQQALAEEEAMYEKLRADAAKNNPFLSSPVSEMPTTASPAPPAATDAAQMIDLFAADTVAASAAQPDAAAAQAAVQAGGNKTSDDLLQLAGNPFADMMTAAAGQAAAPALQQHQPYTNAGADPAASPAAPPAAPAPQPSAFDGFGDILKPESGVGGGGTGGPLLGGTGGAAQPPAKLISGDLDSSLSSLVDNLIIKGPAAKPQWQSPKTPNKTGGANWTPPQPTQGNFARPPQQQQQWAGAPVAGGVAAAGQPATQPPPTTTAAFDPFGAL